MKSKNWLVLLGLAATLGLPYSSLAGQGSSSDILAPTLLSFKQKNTETKDEANQFREVYRYLENAQVTRALLLSTSIVSEAVRLRGKLNEQNLNAYFVHAFVLQSAKQLPEALEYARLATAILDASSKALTSDDISTLTQYADILVELENADAGIEVYRRALKLSEGTLGQEHDETLIVAEKYAKALYHVGQYDQARERIEKLLAAAEGRDLASQDTIRIYISTLREAGRFLEATNKCHELLNKQRISLGIAHRSTLTTQSLCAESSMRLGKAADGTRLLDDLVEIATKAYGAKSPEVLRALFEYAMALTSTTRKKDSLEYMERALDLSIELNGEFHAATLRVLCGYAALLLIYEYPAEGRKVVARAHAVAIAAYGENNLNTLAIEDVLGGALLVTRNPMDAYPYLDRAYRRSKASYGETDRRTLFAAGRLAQALSDIGRHEEALAHSELAINAMKSPKGQFVNLHLAALHNHAMLLIAAGERKKAIEYFERHFEAVEASRTASIDRPNRAEHASSARNIHGYHNFISTLRIENESILAFDLSERTKARALIDDTVIRAVERKATETRADIARAKQLIADLARLEATLRATRDARQADALSEQVAISKDELREIRSTFEAVPEAIRKAGTFDFATSRDASLIPESSQLISFLYQENTIAAAIVGPKGNVHWIDIKVDSGFPETIEAFRLWTASRTTGNLRLRGNAERLRVATWKINGTPRWKVINGEYSCENDKPSMAFADGLLKLSVASPRATIPRNCAPLDAKIVDLDSDYSEILSYLGTKLLDPITPFLQDKQGVIISPDGPLALLPWDILPINGRALAASHNVQLTESLSVYKLTKQRLLEYGQGKSRQALLAFGNPSLEHQGNYVSDQRWRPSRPSEAYADYRWTNLRHAADEISMSARLFEKNGSFVVTQENATEENLREMSASGALAKYRIILFSTHGYFNADTPEFSTLVFRSTGLEPDKDGFVTVEELARLNLRSDLVILSACETARSQNLGGEGLHGMGAALFAAGNANVVLTLWQVDDEATSGFIQSFVAKIGLGIPHGLALAQTKREYMAHSNHKLRNPHFWAGFVLFGV